MGERPPCKAASASEEEESELGQQHLSPGGGFQLNEEPRYLLSVAASHAPSCGADGLGSPGGLLGGMI